jgi:predicted Zn-dependent protease
MTNTLVVQLLALLLTQRPSVPLEKEIAMGRQMAAELERHTRLVSDPVLTEYVNRVGQNLILNSNSNIPFAIRLVNSEDVNALSLPGGFVYVNTGVIAVADSEAELAAVIAHQIAHITARHGAEGFTYTQAPTIQVREADTLGVQYLYKTGYDPRAAIRFLQKVQAGMERIDALERTIASLPAREGNTSTTVEFELIKKRILSKDWK